MEYYLETHIGTALCIIMSIIFGLLMIPFAIWKGKATILISGFNSIPKEKRNHYDTDKMSRDMLSFFFLLTFIWLVGAILTMLSQYFAILAFVVWMIAFLRNVHSDEEKAFGKYKTK
jgi:hypothetical protein